MAEKQKTVTDKLKINYATKTQIDEATDLSDTELYLVDPEFDGNKVLTTDNNGNLIESIVTGTELSELTGVTSNIQQQITAEVSRAITAENELNTTLHAEIIAETNRAKNVEGTLSSLTTDVKTNLVNAINEIDSHTDANTTNITNIQVLIPNEATSQNQLADKDFVNSSISTQTGNFIGTFDSISERDAYAGTVTNNDYCFVINRTVTDNGNDWASFNDLNAYNKYLLTNFDYAWVIKGTKFDLYRFNVVEQIWELKAENTDKESLTLNTAYNRYKASVNNSVLSWIYEYTLNNSSFTAAQWAAINSGATSSLITQITTNKNAIGTLNSLTTTTKDNLVAAINEVNSDLSGYVPYSGATGAVNLNAQNLSNVSKLALNNATIDANEILYVNGQAKLVAGTNSVFIAKNANQTRKGMYGVPMGLEIQWHSDNLPYSYPLGFHDTSINNQGGQFLFTSFSDNISAASAGDVMVENDKGGLIFNTGNSKSGSKMRFVVGNWASTPQLTVTANNVGIKNLNPNSNYALDVTGDINSSTDIKINGTSVALPSQAGNNGKVLTTNGSTASWTALPVVDQTYDSTSSNAQSGKAVKQALISVYKIAGDITFATLPTPTENLVGNVYNITDSFTSDNKFLTNGKKYSAGTNAVIVKTYNTITYSGFYSTNYDNLIYVASGPYNIYLGQRIYTYENSEMIGIGTISEYSIPPETNEAIITAWFDDNETFHYEDNTYNANYDVTLTDTTPAYKYDALCGDLNDYQTTITGAATTITENDLTISRALISNSNGKVAVSEVTSTELGYLSGVTGAIQTQLNTKVEYAVEMRDWTT